MAGRARRRRGGDVSEKPNYVGVGPWVWRDGQMHSSTFNQMLAQYEETIERGIEFDSNPSNQTMVYIIKWFQRENDYLLRKIKAVEHALECEPADMEHCGEEIE